MTKKTKQWKCSIYAIHIKICNCLTITTKANLKKIDFAEEKKLRVFTALFRSKQLEKGLVEVGIIIKGYDWMKK